jgi:hypothetical protein
MLNKLKIGLLATATLLSVTCFAQAEEQGHQRGFYVELDHDEHSQDVDKRSVSVEFCKDFEEKSEKGWHCVYKQLDNDHPTFIRFDANFAHLRSIKVRNHHEDEQRSNTIVFDKPMSDCTIDLSDGAFSTKFFKGYPMLELGYEEHGHESDGRRSSTVECENGLVHWQN